MGAPENELELIGRARAGDRDAFAALCDRHRQRLWRIVTSAARGPDAEDLAQEAVIRAWCSLRSYRGDTCFEAWLTRIAVNVAHDYLKSAWRRRVTLVATDDAQPGELQESPHAAMERRDIQRSVRKAVGGLPPRQSVPIWLTYFEGFSIAEIARLEGTNESTVRSRIAAGLRKLAITLDLSSADEMYRAEKGCEA